MVSDAFTTVALTGFLGLHLLCAFGATAQVHADRLQLMNHSFESPLTYDNTLSEWSLGGTAVATKSGVVLVPGVANRSGQFWHKSPLRTANFELELTFSVTGVDDVTGDGFAFWYMNDEPVIPLHDSIPPESPSLFGNKNPFNGFAVYFAFRDRENNPKSSISASQNDGTVTVDSVRGVPSETGIYYSSLRNSSDPHIFRFSAGPMGIIGQIRTLGSKEWLDCFRLPNTVLKPGGHIGFTGSTPVDPENRTFERVSIESLKVFNLDLSQPGEDSEVLIGTLKDVEVGDLLSEHKHADDLPGVAKELKQLSRLLFKQISEQSPRETMMIRQISSMQANIEKIMNDLRQMQSNQGKPEVVHQVTSELQGLRSLFHSHTKHQENMQQSISSLQKSMNNPSDMAEFAERSAALEATIKQQATFSSWMIFGVIVMIAMFALYMWKRMRDMEKKHFL